MKKPDQLRLYAWIEFAIWLIIIALCVFGIRYHFHKSQLQYKSYQIFMNDVDGLIVGSPVKFLGTQIGNVTKIQLVSSDVYSDIYVKFIITEKDLTLPTGAVATVEGSGLGGSKALTIFPPKEQDSNNIIVAKDSTRLGKVISLFKTIFKDIDEIFTNLGHAGKEISRVPKLDVPHHNEVTPAELNDSLENLNKQLDAIIREENKFKQKIDKMQKKEKSVVKEINGVEEDEPKQSEDNQ
ncbi:MCE family protein [bacterium]|nr:MCE family protein [bacterium]